MIDRRELSRFLKPAVTLLVAAPTLALAAGGHDGGHGADHDMPRMHQGMHQGMHQDMYQDMHGSAPSAGHASAAGRPGDPGRVDRTIAVEMDDTMRFTPAEISVKAGETIRFFVVNKVRLPHEMVIGTADELDEHAEMMRKMPDMKHAEPNQLNLGPGQRGGIVWTFDKSGAFAFACLVPGHKEAGMTGSVVVR